MEEDIKIAKEFIEDIDFFGLSDCAYNKDYEVKILKKCITRLEQLEKENEECKLDVQDYLKQAQENAEIYRKVQKKIQDLKAKVEQLEKENDIKFERILKYEKTLENLQKDTIWKSELEKDYIPKSVIRKKIEEIKARLNDDCIALHEFQRLAKIDILEELLGE